MLNFKTKSLNMRVSMTTYLDRKMGLVRQYHA